MNADPQGKFHRELRWVIREITSGFLRTVGGAFFALVLIILGLVAASVAGVHVDVRAFYATGALTLLVFLIIIALLYRHRNLAKLQQARIAPGDSRPSLPEMRAIHEALYDDAIDVMGRLEVLEDPYRRAAVTPILRYTDIMGSHRHLFVDRDAKALLAEFHGAAQRYGDLRNEAWKASYEYAEAATKRTAESRGHPNVASALMAVFSRNFHLLLGPEGRQRGYVLAHGEYQHIFTANGLGDEFAADSAFDATLKELRALDAVKVLEPARKDCLTKGKKAKERLESIIQDPTSLVLDSRGR